MQQQQQQQQFVAELSHVESGWCRLGRRSCRVRKCNLLQDHWEVQKVSRLASLVGNETGQGMLSPSAQSGE